MNEQSIIIEKTFDAAVEKVWQALTDPVQMKEWYFDIPKFKAEPGFEFQFWAGSEDKKWLHLCKITEVIPKKKLSYTWRYDGYAGESEVSFELIPLKDKTKLILSHKGLETFPKETEELKKANFVEGWNYFMTTALPEFLKN